MIGRYRSLDAWRGLACVMVILHHSTLVYLGHEPQSSDGVLERSAWNVLSWFIYGNTGVALFFVISGYCIAAAAENVRAGRHRIGQYFFRRFRRIYPPFWLVVGFSVVFFLAVDVLIWPGLLSTRPWEQLRPWWYSGWQWLGNLTLTETWRSHVIGDQRAHFPGQAWTLCYEEQFYAITGLLLAISRRRFYVGASVVTVAVLVTMLGARYWGWPVSGFFFDGGWLLFAAGMFVYWAIQQNLGRTPRIIALIVLAAAAALMPRWVAVGNAPVGFLSAGILLTLHPFDDWITSTRVSRALSYCGEMCYSLYLVHQLLVKTTSAALWSVGVQSALGTLLVVVPVAVVVSIVVGRLAFVTIETRFLNTRTTTAGRREPPRVAADGPLSTVSP